MKNTTSNDLLSILCKLYLQRVVGMKGSKHGEHDRVSQPPTGKLLCALINYSGNIPYQMMKHNKIRGNDSTSTPNIYVVIINHKVRL